jgi:nitrate reductase gamma subunit
MAPLDNFTLIGLPYAALLIFLAGTIYRYRANKATYSSLSSQFLEGPQLFWGSLAFHWGILLLFVGHLIAFLVPRSVIAFNAHPARLLIIEVTSFIAGLVVRGGLLMLFVRRVSNARLRVVTSRMDIVVEILLLVQVVLGVVIALQFRWGSSWFAAVLTPYLRSIFVFQPDISAVSTMPWMVKLHLAGAYLLLALVPFTRLVHALVLPAHYIWRPYQRVLWAWDPSRVRRPETKWSATDPRNN